MIEEKSLILLQHYKVLEKYVDQGFVFKKCIGYNDYDCLVILKKPVNNFKCNEERQGIHNKNWAKFRCNGLITIAIYNLKSQQFITNLSHYIVIDAIRFNIIYQVGKLSTPNSYNEDISIVCTSGIHYFLTLEAALNYVDGYVMIKFASKCVSYDETGKKIWTNYAK